MVSLIELYTGAMFDFSDSAPRKCQKLNKMFNAIVVFSLGAFYYMMSIQMVFCFLSKVAVFVAH